jgi:hypothetical protein
MVAVGAHEFTGYGNSRNRPWELRIQETDSTLPFRHVSYSIPVCGKRPRVAGFFTPISGKTHTSTHIQRDDGLVPHFYLKIISK